MSLQLFRFFRLAVLLSAASAATLANASPSVATSRQVDQWCQRLSPRLPDVSLAMCVSSQLSGTGALSNLKFPILARRIAASPVKGKEPVRILLLGGIHGDELTASAIVFQWLQWMQMPAAQQFNWSVAPVVNPDGLLATKPNRVNAKGVDLNRNFPTPDWRQEAPRYWSKATGGDPRRFPGKAPLSEPESRWVNDEIERFHPQVIISVHAPFGVLDFDGPAPTPDRFGRLVFNPVGVYPGSLGNYSGMYRHIPVITIELPNANVMPPPAEVQRIWLDMLSWIDKNIARRGKSPVTSTLPAAHYLNPK